MLNEIKQSIENKRGRGSIFWKAITAYQDFEWSTERFYEKVKWEVKTLRSDPDKAYFTTGLLASLAYLTRNKQIKAYHESIEKIDRHDAPRIILPDVTFIIPVKYDSEERKNNLARVLEYLTKYFDARILLYEEGEKPLLGHLSDQADFFFTKSEESTFHKAALINAATAKCVTDYFAIHDADILADPVALLLARDLLKQKTAAMVHPCYTTFLPDQLATKEILNDEVKYAWSESKQFKEAKKWPGGVVMFKKKSFVAAGMANERFASWGLEDSELDLRFRKLGHKVKWLPFSMLHLWHPETPTSHRDTGNHRFILNRQEYDKIKNMTKNELLNYVSSWKQGGGTTSAEKKRL